MVMVEINFPGKLESPEIIHLDGVVPEEMSQRTPHPPRPHLSSSPPIFFLPVLIISLLVSLLLYFSYVTAVRFFFLFFFYLFSIVPVVATLYLLHLHLFFLPSSFITILFLLFRRISIFSSIIPRPLSSFCLSITCPFPPSSHLLLPSSIVHLLTCRHHLHPLLPHLLSCPSPSFLSC